MLTTVLSLLLFQSKPFPSVQELMWKDPSKVSFTTDPDRAAEARQRAFRERFQKLVDALERFADVYNRGRGAVWPLKEAEAVRKAYRSLEGVMPLEKKREGSSGSTPVNAGNTY